MLVNFKTLNIVSICTYILVLLPKVKGQGYYDEIFNHYTNQTALYNIAAVTDTSAFYLNIKHKALSNNAIYNSSLQFNGRLLNKNTSQNLAISIQNSQQGPYIQAPKAYVGYYIVTPISLKLKFSAGALIGVNSLWSSVPTQRTSVAMPDGSIAINLQSKNYSGGIALYNMLNNKRNGYWLKRYINVNTSAQFILNNNYNLQANALARIFTDYQADIKTLWALDYANKLRFGTILTSYGIIQGFVEPTFSTSEHVFKVSVGYNTQLQSRKRFLANSLELGITWMK